ncbi:MAG TPA: M28 family metallopeptidase [Miltoncostaea sp.]|nr:M28 family metallopeptidase [Miltoncostaea sp.]
MPLRTRLAAACVALAAAVVAGCAGAGAATRPEAPRPTVDRFDAARAWADLEMQVELGPRPAGSQPSRVLAERLRRALPGGRFEAVPGGLRNVVGTLPGRGRPILLAAHYDTKDIPGFVGANDGAGGTATVLEVTRALERAGGPACQRRVRVVMLDGEESPGPGDGADFATTGLRGSRADAARTSGRLHAAIVVDFVADADLSLPREAFSDPALWARLRSAAGRVGVGRVFPARPGPAILDDHLPYRQRGVPSIDLIDFTFPQWHTVRDDLSAVSPRSLDAAGEALVEMLRTMRRETCPGASRAPSD